MTVSFSSRVRRCMLAVACFMALSLPAGRVLAAPIPNPKPNPWQPPVASAQQLLPDGGFEVECPALVYPCNHTPPITNPWYRGGAMVIASAKSIYDPYVKPHCGTNMLASGGNWGGGGFAYQQVTIPTDSQPVLTLYVDVHTSIPTTWALLFPPSDSLRVQVYSGTPDAQPSATLLSTVATFTNWDGTGLDWARKGSYDFSAYRGQTIQVWFWTSITSSSPTTTNFYLDDIGLWTYPPLVTSPC